MTVEELFKKASEETCFMVSVHDTHYHYLETPEGDTVFDVCIVEPDDHLMTLKKVYAFHIIEWWVTFNGGVIHIQVEEDIVN